MENFRLVVKFVVRGDGLQVRLIRLIDCLKVYFEIVLMTRLVISINTLRS